MNNKKLAVINQAIEYHASNAQHYMNQYGEAHDNSKDIAPTYLRLSKYHYKLAKAIAELRDDAITKTREGL